MIYLNNRFRVKHGMTEEKHRVTSQLHCHSGKNTNACHSDESQNLFCSPSCHSDEGQNLININNRFRVKHGMTEKKHRVTEEKHIMAELKHKNII